MENEIKYAELVAKAFARIDDEAALILDDTPLGVDVYYEYLKPKLKSLGLSVEDCKTAAQLLLKKAVSLTSDEAKLLRIMWFIPKAHYTFVKDTWNCTPKDRGYWILLIDSLNALTKAADEIRLKEISPIDRYAESNIMRDGLTRIRKFFDDSHYMTWSRKAEYGF